MITIKIDEETRLKAYNIALERALIARKYGRVDGLFHHDYTSLEADWQGAIAEVIMLREYPVLRLDQPFIVDGTNTLAADFKIDDIRIEVKTARWTRIHPTYFINEERFQKKKHLTQLVVCTAINNHPKIADLFYIFGYIESYKITKGNYPLRTDISSPAYTVPLQHLQPIPEFWKEEGKL